MDNALEAGGREGKGVIRGQESRMRENPHEHLGPQEMNPFKAASPHQVTSAGVQDFSVCCRGVAQDW